MIALLFVVAIGHKILVVVKGQAASEALIEISPLRSRFPNLFLTVASLFEAASAAALIGQPVVGFASASALVLMYAHELKQLAPEQPCECFGALLQTPSRSTAIWRNLLIAAVCLAGFLSYAGGAVDVVSLDGAVLGVAALGTAAIVGVESFRSLFPTEEQIG